MTSNNEHLLVAAIDFGTTYSGYAFSFLHNYQRDPLKIESNNWTAGSGGLMSLKTSTCVLFRPDRTFHSFGFEAEDKYSDLALDDECEGWYYFRRFKMKLYDNKCLNRTFKLEADQGQMMPAIKVFSSAIRYLKTHLMKTCKNQMTHIVESDIQWVLTVPAIWSDPSKQFMREAAEEAGIDGSHLIIALEPEAASLYCKYLPLDRKGESGLKSFTAGSMYMVLDAGGGTIDITVHEVQYDGSVKEIHKANGGDWGGTKVDHAFQVLISEIIGNAAFQSFMQQNKADMVEFFRDFEVKKLAINPESDKINFKIPTTMNDSCKRKNGNDIATIVTSTQKYRGSMSVTGDKLRVSAIRARELFIEPSREIVKHVKKLLEDPSVSGVTSILMVGGFSESRVLQQDIRSNFPDLRIIVPQDAGLAVLKGAVIFGHEPRAITTRICKYTYGVKCSRLFNPEKHDPAERFTTSYGEERCNNIFGTHVSVGKSVRVGEPQAVRTYTLLEPDATTMEFNVYISTEKNPTYITDPGCTKIGKMSIKTPNTSKGLDRSVQVQFTFSNTELEIACTDTVSGEKVTAAFDFL